MVQEISTTVAQSHVSQLHRRPFASCVVGREKAARFPPAEGYHALTAGRRAAFTDSKIFLNCAEAGKECCTKQQWHFIRSPASVLGERNIIDSSLTHSNRHYIDLFDHPVKSKNADEGSKLTRMSWMQRNTPQTRPVPSFARSNTHAKPDFTEPFNRY